MVGRCPLLLLLLLSTPLVQGFAENKEPIIRLPTAPFEKVKLFDQFVFAKNVQPSFLREAELKHGRLAMVAALLLPLSEHFSPDLGINLFQNHHEFIPSGVWLMFNGELKSMVYGWEDPSVKPFKLKEDYQPGYVGFNTIDESKLGAAMDKELNNGRLAMFGILGMMTQELVTHQQLF
jgi:hypothetical protein